MVVEFWCKSPSCKSGICSALLRLRTDFAETTSDNDVSLPEMFNSAVSYIFSLTQPNMFIFRTHNLVQNPTSDPATIWWQSFQDQVPLANSGMLQSLDWRDHKSENGFEEAMHWFQPTEIARNHTKSLKIYMIYNILQPCRNSDSQRMWYPTKFVTKADPCYIPRLWCASSGALPWRPIAMVFVERSHQGDLEDRGGMGTVAWIVNIDNIVVDIFGFWI